MYNEEKEQRICEIFQTNKTPYFLDLKQQTKRKNDEKRFR